MFEVEPLADHEKEILAEFKDLSLKCADGFDAMLGILSENEPSILDRCGLLADRYEIFAIPIPDCSKRQLIISIDCKCAERPRIVHGTLDASARSCDNGCRLATNQFRLINPTWEPQL